MRSSQSILMRKITYLIQICIDPKREFPVSRSHNKTVGLSTQEILIVTRPPEDMKLY